jgi:gamma-glutamyltranspeptidase / glutathione hydrolase
MDGVEPGVPPGVVLVRGKDATLDVPGTSHISIVDAQGNVVSMTTTIESAFGSKQMVRGFLLNNQLTDFSFAPTDDSGRPVANSVAPGKRPRSSMAPTIVFDRQGRVRLVLGSPGGGEIIQYVAKTLIGVLDWQLDIQRAIDFGNFGGRDTPTIKLEAGTSLEALAPALTALGHSVALRDENSGVHGIAIRYLSDGGRVLEGGADPRREGVAGGNAQDDLPQQKKRTGP